MTTIVQMPAPTAPQNKKEGEARRSPSPSEPKIYRAHPAQCHQQRPIRIPRSAKLPRGRPPSPNPHYLAPNSRLSRNRQLNVSLIEANPPDQLEVVASPSKRSTFASRSLATFSALSSP